MRPARPQLRHRRRGRLDPHRRGPHAADHLRPGRPVLALVHRVRPAGAADAQRDVHYEVDERKRTVGVTEAGRRVHRGPARHRQPLRGGQHAAGRLPEQRAEGQGALQAGQGLHRPRRRGADRRRVHRPRAAGRRYNEGMHQAIEAKEGVEIKAENQTLATITLQNYFRLYDKLAGMTGTAETEAAEFHQTYKLGVVSDPDQQADDPRGRVGPDLQDRGGQVRGGRRGHRRAAREGPAGPGRHHQRGEVRVPVEAAGSKRASRTRCSTRSTTTGRR